MPVDSPVELFRHDNIAVTRSWIIVSGVQHAVRYVDQTALTSDEPPRETALMVLGVCVVLAIITLIRVIGGDLSLGFAWVLLAACAIVILVAGHIAFVAPSQHSLTVRFKNGETITISTNVASRAMALQTAIHDALDHLDYHDTDNASPAVVLASLEPTKLTTIHGHTPRIAILDDSVSDYVVDDSTIDDEIDHEP